MSTIMLFHSCLWIQVKSWPDSSTKWVSHLVKEKPLRSSWCGMHQKHVSYIIWALCICHCESSMECHSLRVKWRTCAWVWCAFHRRVRKCLPPGFYSPPSHPTPMQYPDVPEDFNHFVTQVRLDVQDNQRTRQYGIRLSGVVCVLNVKGEKETTGPKGRMWSCRKTWVPVLALAGKSLDPEGMFGLSQGWKKLLKCLHQPRKMSQRANIHWGSWEEQNFFHSSLKNIFLWF